MVEWEGGRGGSKQPQSPRGGGGGAHGAGPHHRAVVAATKTMESSYENEVLVIDWPVKFLFLLIDSQAVNNIDTSGGTTQYE